MSQRFNFYDIYGYLIPGLALVTLLWLPFGMINPGLVNASLAAAAAAIVVGYIVGHFITAMAGGLMSAKTARTKDGKAEFPSIVLLNPSNNKMSPYLKKWLAKNVLAQFSLDLQVHEEADEEIGKIRQAAFFLCRPVVNKMTAYPEQFQGLYAMMSGLTTAFALGFFYMTGWTVAAYWDPASAVTVVHIGIWVLLAATIWFAIAPKGRRVLALVVFALLSRYAPMLSRPKHPYLSTAFRRLS